VRLTPESPSAAAGIRAGDVIESLDGRSIEDASKLLQVLAKQRPGDKIKLGVDRDGESLEMEIMLSSRAALFEER
jgi:S1-C subfamily serine protease